MDGMALQRYKPPHADDIRNYYSNYQPGALIARAAGIRRMDCPRRP